MQQIHSFLEWFGERVPVAQLHFITNLLRSVEDTIGVRVNLKYFFAPIFGDRTAVGRSLSVIVRFIIVIAGLLIVGSLSLILVILPIIWLLAPLLAIVYPILITIPAIGILYYIFRGRKTPAKLYPTNFNPNKINLYSDHDSVVILDKYLSGDFYRLLENNLSIIHFKERMLITYTNFEEKLTVTPQKDKSLLLNELVDYARTHKIRFFRPTHIFYAIIKLYEKELSPVLLEKKLDLAILEKYTIWDEYEYNLTHQPQPWDEDYRVNVGGGTNRTWQGTVTPILNQFSVDITAQAQTIFRQVHRTGLVNQIEQALNKSENANVLLVGEPGVGKETLVKQIAYLINYGGASGPLWSKRIVELDVGQLFSNSGERGGFESRVESILYEITRSGNIILYLNDFNSAIQTSTPNGLSLFSLLQNPIAQKKLHIIGSLTPQEYKAMETASLLFLKQFTTIRVPETNKEETSHILHTECINLEEKHKLFFPYTSIETIVEYATTYIHDSAMPQKALNLLDDVIVYIEQTNMTPTLKTIYGMRVPVTEELIDTVVTSSLAVPVGRAQRNEADTLLHLEEKFQKHIIDQTDAVKAISEVIRRNRSGLREQNKPIGSFLFVGPTGVGKTEMAKTVAQEYFGNDKYLVRLDMSEFQTANSIERLLGYSNSSDAVSSLTERVRKQPFSLVLLDELEKAHPQILDIFLQVLDDARLTDVAGTTVDFSQTIVIATSNAATDEITQLFNSVNSPKDYNDLFRLVYELLKPYYRVEFLNRFDQIIIFKPLTPRSIEKIVRLQLTKLAEKLYETKKITLTFKETTIQDLIKTGYNKDLGARPLQREIQNKIESKLAIMLLEESVKEGGKVEL
jgi:ATP-dependent Clp protease ATP-binding subunit ClpA